jgi:cytochrome P460
VHLNPRVAIVPALSVLLLGAWALQARQGTQRPPRDQVPRFTQDGALIRPEGWEAWVMVGASTGLSYNDPPPPSATSAPQGPGMFHNVYMQPWAYRELVRTGAFPEGTMFVLAFYEPSRKATPARAGFFEGEQDPGIEIHLKKAGVDSTGWGFYGFGDSTRTAARIPSVASCYSCHAREAAHDQVFTQFYPPLRARLGRSAP